MSSLFIASIPSDSEPQQLGDPTRDQTYFPEVRETQRRITIDPIVAEEEDLSMMDLNEEMPSFDLSLNLEAMEIGNELEQEQEKKERARKETPTIAAFQQRPFLANHVKFDVPRLKLKGRDQRKIEMLKKEVDQYVKAGVDQAILIEKIRAHCEEPHLLSSDFKWKPLRTLEALFAHMEILNKKQYADIRSDLNNAMCEVIQEEGERFKNYFLKMSHAFHMVCETHGMDALQIERTMEKAENLAFVRHMLHKNMLPVNKKFINTQAEDAHSLGLEELVTLVERREKGDLVARAVFQNEESPPAHTINALNRVNNENTERVQERDTRCWSGDRCRRRNCHFSHPTMKRQDFRKRNQKPFFNRSRPWEKTENNEKFQNVAEDLVQKEIAAGKRCRACLMYGHTAMNCQNGQGETSEPPQKRLKTDVTNTIQKQDNLGDKQETDSFRINEIDQDPTDKKLFIKINKSAFEPIFNAHRNAYPLKVICEYGLLPGKQIMIDTGIMIQTKKNQKAKIVVSTAAIAVNLSVEEEVIPENTSKLISVLIKNNGKRRIRLEYFRNQPLAEIKLSSKEEDVAQVVNHIAERQSTLQTPYCYLSIGKVTAEVLVDTGAATSCLSEEIYQKYFKGFHITTSAMTLKSATNDMLDVIGYVLLPIKISTSERIEKWLVIRHLSPSVILGYPSLHKLHATIDTGKGMMELCINGFKHTIALHSNKRMLNGVNVIDGRILNIDLKHLAPQHQADIQKILIENANLFCENNAAPSAIDADKGSHLIRLEANTRPISQPPRRIAPAIRNKVDEMIEKLLHEGLIKPSKSPWGSPIVVVPKKGGDIRICVDYRKLNSYTIKDVYPLPRMDDILDALSNATVFSTLDLASGYHQVPMAEESQPLTAFVTHQGLFEYTRMPFGLCNAPATFQRLMDTVLSGLKWKKCLVYLDDIIIFGDTAQSHLENLKDVLEAIKNAGLKLKAEKCKFAYKEISYLGHLINEHGLKQDPEKVKSIQEFSVPPKGEKKAIESFLGMAGYFQSFIKNFNILADPLRQLVKKDAEWNWTEECQNSFDEIKANLTNAPVLARPDLTGKYPFVVQCDASESGIGAVLLQQQKDESYKVIKYASRSLSSSERKWHVTEQEALAVIWACEKFAEYVMGTKFIVESDHSSLQWLMGFKKGRLVRWALRAAEFNFDIVHKKGIDNKVADHLSRYPITDEIHSDRDGRLEHNINAIEHVSADKSDQTYCIDLSSSSLKEKIKIAFENDSIYGKYARVVLMYKKLKMGERVHEKCDFYLGTDMLLYRKTYATSPLDGTRLVKNQLVIPESLRKDILLLYHDNELGGHFGRNRMILSISDKLWWPGLTKDIRKYIASCEQCQRYKSTFKCNRPLFSSRPRHIWETACIDLVGPFPESAKGNKYICVITDLFSKWAEAVPIPAKTEDVVANAIFTALICQHGIPQYIRTDQGREFNNSLLTRLMKRMNIKHKMTNPYYPQANGHVERFNRTLVESISKQCECEPTKWDNYIPGTLFAYRTSKHAELLMSPFEILYGRTPKLPVDIYLSDPGDIQDDCLVYNTRLTYNLQKMHKTIRSMLVSTAKKRDEQWLEKAKPLILKEGQHVLIKKLRPFKVDQPKDKDVTPTISHKLESEWEGPFKVLKKSEFNTVIVFDEKKLTERKVAIAHCKLFQTRDEPQTIEEDPLKLFYVEEILSHQRTRKGITYLVKWQDYDEGWNSWETEKSFQETECIQAYWDIIGPTVPQAQIPKKYKRIPSKSDEKEKGTEKDRRRYTAGVVVPPRSRRQIKQPQRFLD